LKVIESRGAGFEQADINLIIAKQAKNAFLRKDDNPNACVQVWDPVAGKLVWVMAKDIDEADLNATYTGLGLIKRAEEDGYIAKELYNMGVKTEYGEALAYLEEKAANKELDETDEAAYLMMTNQGLCPIRGDGTFIFDSELYSHGGVKSQGTPDGTTIGNGLFNSPKDWIETLEKDSVLQKGLEEGGEKVTKDGIERATQNYIDKLNAKGAAEWEIKMVEDKGARMSHIPALTLGCQDFYKTSKEVGADLLREDESLKNGGARRQVTAQTVIAMANHYKTRTSPDSSVKRNSTGARQVNDQSFTSKKQIDAMRAAQGIYMDKDKPPEPRENYTYVNHRWIHKSSMTYISPPPGGF
jgi:hypothetical protein